MQSTYHFFLFLSVLFIIYLYMQWYILHNYFHWLKKIASKKNYFRLRNFGIVFFTISSIVFLLRFPSTHLGWYEYPWFQYLIIYPGGVYFGFVIVTFSILLAIRIAYRVVTLLEKLTNKNINHFFKTSKLTGSGNISPLHHNTQNDFKSNHNSTEVTGRSTGVVDNPVGEQDHPLHAPNALHTGKIEFDKSVSITGQESGHHSVKKSGLISRRQFLRSTGTAVIAAPSVFIIGASAATAHDYHIVHQKLRFPGLPASLNGLRIAQISDIHSGIYMTENQMNDIFELANEQHPDIVTITGDFVDNSTSEIPALYRSITRLKSEYGIFGCLGNHDHYASASAVSSALLQRDFRLLTNDHQTLTINGERLSLIGVDDAGSGSHNFAHLDKALLNVPDDSFQILLSHRPDMFDDARQHGIDLTLSGHTHGGQIGFEMMGMSVYPIHLFQKYAKGLYENDGHKLYVNVGIGMVGVPIRMVRPELTVFELTNSISEV